MHAARTIHFSVALGVWLLSATVVAPLAAQVPREQRQQFVQKLLNTLIDSQIPAQPQNRSPGDGRPPAQPSAARRPAATLLRTSSPQVREAGRLLTSAANETTQLVAALQADLGRAPELRRLMNSALQVNAHAAVLSQRLASGAELDSLRDDLRQLDQDWRMLEHYLGEIPDLSRTARESIGRVQDYERQLCDLFDVPPQVNRAELAQHASTLVVSVRNLAEDIQFEITDKPTANRLLLELRSVYEQAQQFQKTTGLASSYERLRSEYQGLHEEWRAFAAQLWNTPYRYVQRQLQRVHTTDRAIYELLWLPAQAVDMAELRHLTDLIQRDTETLLNRVSLRMLTELPAARALQVASATEFRIACDDFHNCVESRERVETLRDLCESMNQYWQPLLAALQGIDSRNVRESLQDVDRSLRELRQVLGIREDFDREATVATVAALIGLADELRVDVQNVFGRPNRYPRDFQAEAVQATNDFQNSAQSLHSRLTNNERLPELRAQVERLAAQWESVARLLPRFTIIEQQEVGEIRRRITPLVVELQTTLSL